MGGKRQDMRDVLIGTHHDQRPLRPVDAAQIEDVGTVLEIRAEHLLVVPQAESALGRQQQAGQTIDCLLYTSDAADE
mgnify:CR=1 FL=1